MDAVVEAARQGAPGDWPHAHPDLPAAQVPLATFLQCVADTFTVEGRPWSIARDGLPPLPGEDGPPGSVPNSGSKFHNLMHGLLGDFH